MTRVRSEPPRLFPTMLTRALFRRSPASLRPLSTVAAGEDDIIFKSTHWELRRALRKLIDAEINPHVDAWEKAGIFPAHEVGVRPVGEHARCWLNTQPLDRRRSSRSWATRAFWASRSQSSLGAAAWTTPTPWPSRRSWAASAVAVYPWPSACRRTWPRPPLPSSAPMS